LEPREIIYTEYGDGEMSTFEFVGLNELIRQHDQSVGTGKRASKIAEDWGFVLDSLLHTPHTGTVNVYKEIIEVVTAWAGKTKNRYAMALLKIMSHYDNDPYIQIALNFDDKSVKMKDKVPDTGVWFTQRVEGKTYLFYHPDKNFKIKYVLAVCYGKSSDIYEVMKRQKLVMAGLLTT
jgi:hypothetical protein